MRIMAIDYGDAHTGIAISDPTGLLAGFTTVINAYRPDRVTGQIALLAKEHRVERLVLGHPINMDGTRGPRSEKAQAMRQLLKETTGLPVVLWDERRTTIDAHQILMSSGKNAKKRKKVVDAVAASLILEGYLTYLKTHPEGYGKRSRTYQRPGPLAHVPHSAASSAQAGTSAAEGTSSRNSRRTSGPQKKICQKNAMGKLQTTVWSQEGTNSIPGCWKITVAHRLMAGHMTHTVMADRARTAAKGHSRGTASRAARRAARGSPTTVLVRKHSANISGSSRRAFRIPAFVRPPFRRPVLYISMASTMKKDISRPKITFCTVVFGMMIETLLVLSRKRGRSLSLHRLRPADLFLSQYLFFHDGISIL